MNNTNQISTFCPNIPKTQKKSDDDNVEISVTTPFNICILGEVSDEALIRNQLNRYFQKIGVDSVDWSIDFYNNSKLQNSKILRSLQKGQSKYSLIVTGQIFIILEKEMRKLILLRN